MLRCRAAGDSRENAHEKSNNVPSCSSYIGYPSLLKFVIEIFVFFLSKTPTGNKTESNLSVRHFFSRYAYASVLLCQLREFFAEDTWNNYIARACVCVTSRLFYKTAFYVKRQISRLLGYFVSLIYKRGQRMVDNANKYPYSYVIYFYF